MYQYSIFVGPDRSADTGGFAGVTDTLLVCALTVKRETGLEGMLEGVQMSALVRKMLEANIYVAEKDERETDCAMSNLDQY